LEYKKTCAHNTYLQPFYIVSKHLDPHFGKKDIAKITQLQFEKYLMSKKEAGFKIADHKKHIKGILKLAKKYGEDVRVFDLDVFDPTIGRGKIFTREEIIKLLWFARNRSNNNKKSWNLRLQIYMALTMGMRKGEILSFKWEYINFTTGWIYLPPEAQKVRTTTDRAFPCNRIVLRILKARHSRSQSPYLFPNGHGETKSLVSKNEQWRRLKRVVGIKGRFHDLRHTACSYMLSKGVPEVFVKKLLGMCSDTIRRYAHVPERDAIIAVNDTYSKTTRFLNSVKPRF
jgi:integrase